MEASIEIFDGKFVFTRSDGRKLVYDYKRCVGCGICVYACPVNAIDLNPVHDIALGLDMPPVTIDHTVCVFCGICFALCPLKAFEFYLGDFEIKKEFCPVWLEGKVEKNENCVNCAVCYRACPMEAIDRKIKLRREDIPVKNEGISGRIEIDEEKCRLCGICVEFCSAFVGLETEDLREGKVFERIAVDKERCDYCELCMDVCPNEAIKVEGRRVVEGKVEDIAEVIIDVERCVYCGVCAKICPYDGVDVEKAINGSVVVYEGLLGLKCDPTGCKACVLICPTGAWRIEEGKPVVDEDMCLHCGACENACHERLITVRWDRFVLKKNEGPWTEGWMRAMERVLKRERAERFERVEQKEMEKVGSVMKISQAESKSFEGKVDERLAKRLEEIERSLSNIGFRRKIELRP